MTNNKIKDYLPHRYPFLFIDKILKVKTYNYILAIKNITISEYFFTGHFPNKPIMPGVLIVESLAQTSGLLINISLKKKNDIPNFFLGRIDKTKFKKIVVPGDQLYLEVNVINIKKIAWKFSGNVFLNGNIICSSKFTCIKNEN